jgi:hypothetical protein
MLQKIEQARIGSLMPAPGFRLTMGDDLGAAMATRHLIDLGASPDRLHFRVARI